MYDKKGAAAAQRSAERRQREDDASRLKKEIPSLRKLRIVIAESGALGIKKHSKLVVIANAPALFVFPCGDENCQGGGHDLTTWALYSLRALRTTFSERDACSGSVG